MEVAQFTATWATLARVIVTLALLWLSYQALAMVEKHVLTPLRIKRVLERQGVRGPPGKWLTGNTLEKAKLLRDVSATDMETGDYNLVRRLMPEHVQWTKLYGKTHLWWFGSQARLTIADPELVKEILMDKTGAYGKPQTQMILARSLVGRGVATTEGEEWALHRRVVSPAFQHDKIKDMIRAMQTSTSIMLGEWEKIVGEGGGSAEVEAHEQIVKVTADIISRTAFGSSYDEGKKVVAYQDTLAKNVSLGIQSVFASFPGYRTLPTEMNRKTKKIEKALHSLLTDIIQVRTDAVKKGGSECYGNDLLGLMLIAADEETASKGGKVQFGMQPLIEECKLFFFAGHESSSSLLTWALMFLGTYTEWQDRARNEVMELCRDGSPPDIETISNMKVMSMILNETLRLYPPVALGQVRQATRDMKLGQLEVPKGLYFNIPRVAFHQDPELWGEDALEFKPERFANGATKACKHQMAFTPFSFGPRFCVGQAFALQESKIVMAMLLQKFRFRLSPNYRHNPVHGLTLAPKHGMLLVVESLRTLQNDSDI